MQRNRLLGRVTARHVAMAMYLLTASGLWALWPPQPRLTRMLDRTAEVGALAPDGRTLVVAERPGDPGGLRTLRVIDVATGQDLAHLGGPAGSADGEHFEADGALYFMNGYDPTGKWTAMELTRYDPRTDQASVLHRFLPPGFDAHYVVSPDGRVVALTKINPSGARLLDAATGRVVGEDSVSSTIGPAYLRYMNGNRTLFLQCVSSCGTGNPPTQWLFMDIATARLHRNPDGQVRMLLTPWDAATAVSPDGRWFASWENRLEGSAVVLVEVATGAKRELRPDVLMQQGKVTGKELWYVGDGTLLLAIPGGPGPAGQTLLFLDAATGRVLAQHAKASGLLAASPDGRLLAARLTDPATGIDGLYVLDAATGAPQTAVAAGERGVDDRGVRFSRDSRLLDVRVTRPSFFRRLRRRAGELLGISRWSTAPVDQEHLIRYDVVTGQPDTVLPFEPTPLPYRGVGHAFAYEPITPDGRTAVCVNEERAADGSIAYLNLEIWDVPARPPLGTVLAFAALPAACVLLIARRRKKDPPAASAMEAVHGS